MIMAGLLTPPDYRTMSKKATAMPDVSISRRQSLLLGGSILAGGGSLFALTHIPTASALSVDSFDVTNNSFESETISPKVVVDLAYSFQTSEVPEEVRLKLQVGNETVEQTYLNPDQSQVNDTIRLTGLVTDSSAWASSDFTVEPGETVTRQLNVAILLDVVVNGEVVTSDTKTDTTTIELSHPDQITVTSSIGGSGEIQAA